MSFHYCLLLVGDLLGMSNTPLRVATYNCRSVKQSLLDIKILCNSHDVILLQETWLLPHDLNFLNSIHSDFLSFGTSAVDTSVSYHVGRPFGGIAFLWRKVLGYAVAIQKYDDPRILGLSVDSETRSLIINVYMPTAEPENHELYQDYLGKLNAIVVEPGCGHVIIPGDWNAKKGRLEFQWVQDFCCETELVMSDDIRLPVALSLM